MFVEYSTKFMGGAYKVDSVNGEKVKGNPTLWDYSNALGKDGWEYVVTLGETSQVNAPSYMVFKRAR